MFCESRRPEKAALGGRRIDCCLVRVSHVPYADMVLFLSVRWLSYNAKCLNVEEAQRG